MLAEILSPKHQARASYKKSHVLDMLMDDDEFEVASDSGVSDLSEATIRSEASRR